MNCQKLLILFLFLAFAGCKNKKEPSLPEPGLSEIKKYYPDTSTWFGKDEYRAILRRKELAISLQLSDMDEGSDTFEVRLWWEASIYSPSHIWQIQITKDSQIAKRIDYYINFESSRLDSFVTIPQVPTSKNWQEYIAELDTVNLWNIPHFKQPNKGCVDGEKLTIEIGNARQYKSVSYPCYTIFRDSSSYLPFSIFSEAIMNLIDYKK